MRNNYQDLQNIAMGDFISTLINRRWDRIVLTVNELLLGIILANIVLIIGHTPYPNIEHVGDTGDN